MLARKYSLPWRSLLKDLIYGWVWVAGEGVVLPAWRISTAMCMHLRCGCWKALLGSTNSPSQISWLSHIFSPLILSCFVVFWDRVSLCGPGWPETQRDLPASASQVLGSKVCASTARQGIPLSCKNGDDKEIQWLEIVFSHVTSHLLLSSLFPK